MNAAIRLALSITVSGMVCLTAPAQVPDGASNTYINATNAFVDVTIGTNGSFTLLTLGNNAMFTNAGSGTIGFNTTAMSNEVRLISPTARWFVGNQIHVGSNGSFNRLLVSNGATVRAFNGNLSLGTGSNNLALVTGPGSTWSNANVFYVGFNGSGNQLVLSNGGVLYNNNAAMGVNSGGFSNIAIVTGSGSLWSNRSDLSIGLNGAGTRLEVRDGGYVRNRVGSIGSQVGATNILALVTGVGSTWSNAAELYIGVQGPANQMIVEAGGTVRSAIGYIGANFTASNNLALITGAGSMWSNEVDLVVGSFSAFNRLVVSNGALARNAMNGVIGPTANGNANAVRVTDAGSRWVVGNTLYVGSNSALNQLIVTNGGQVSGLGGVSGAVGWSAAASSNLAIVTGSGSVWSNANFLYIGGNAAGNQLVVSNAGVVLADQNITGSNIPSSNNVVTVIGPGSRLETDGVYYLGFNGAANRLHIKNGGVVRNVATYIGINPSGSNNLAFVSDPGSAWTNLNQLRVGAAGPGNQLVVSNGGRVFVGEVAMVGESATSTNNRVLVEGGDLRVISGSSTAIMDIRRGTNVLNAGLMEVDRLLMTNALSRFDFNGGTLITRGAAMSNEESLWMGASSTNPAIWTVLTGAGDHELAVPLFIGATSPFNQLLITNGGRMLSSRLAIIGLNSTAVSNSATISGPNSRWSLTDLYVGYSGDGCRLVIANGGLLSANYTTVGGEGSTVNCEAVVTDPGSVLSNALTGGLQIGSTGSSNRVRIENGGTLFGSVQVGRTWQSGGNLLSVTGSGSSVQVLTNFVPISVGYDGPASRMEVSEGGAVLGYEGEIGRSMSSSNNLVLVTGTGSMWSNINDFYVGVSAAGNRLYVTNGGALYNYNGFLGGNTYSSNNQAWVIGPGSTWTNYRELSVGLNGIGNQLVITNGGTVFTVANKYVGKNDGALSNIAVVTDPGSAWLGNDSLYVGADGSLNRLFVCNGGRVVSGTSTVGGLFGANGNQAWVTDGSSVWTNQFDLNVGEFGAANFLVVSNGATVFSASDAFLGRFSGANSNVVILTDLGTRWLISSNLYVGSNAAFNWLVVSNGARLHDRFAVIGGGSSSSNNAAIISGVGSVWSNTLDLTIGDSGTANQMVISSGAFVTCSNGTLGGKIASSNNTILVTGAGSVWSNRGGLFVSQAGNGNRLIISDGGLVHTMVGGFLGGSFATGTNNEVVVTGPGSFWRLPSTLFVGYVAGGNRLVITNGGWVYNSTANVGLIGNSNEVLVTGTGSSWTNSGTMVMGVSGSHNRLIVSNGGVVYEPLDLRVGENASSTNNRIVVDGGILVMESSTFGVFDIKRGTNVLNSGRIFIGRELLVTNILGIFEFNGGTLQASGTSYTNGRVFTVGNGTSPAIFELAGGEHAFANGLTVANHGILTGQGSVRGPLTAQLGSVIAPGIAVGTLALNNPPVLQGTLALEIRGGAVALEHDQIQVAGGLTYGGSLVVSNSGGSALLSGDRFQLFGATGFSGAFTNILLPPLTVGLQWTNKLNLDGSIEVVPYQPLPVTLTLQRSNGVLFVSWPTNGADYCLETAFDLSPPITWHTVSSGITTNGGSFVLTLAGSGQSLKQFFRLAFPCATSPVTLALQINNNLITVSWPSNAFRLETALSLSPPITWQTINTGIVDSDGVRTFSVTNNAAVTNQFFRLASP